MSNALAIAAVTTTLRDRISREIGAGVLVSCLPPNLARNSAAATTSQINLYMYQITPNASMRNTSFNAVAVTGSPGAAAQSMPPLALNLHYLLTAYGNGDSETDTHRLLGIVMAALNDHPILELDEIRDATAASLGDNDLANQIERVRVTLMPLTTDDYYKLWSGFQSAYRISVAYEARVVLIDTKLPTRSVLPVLTIGPYDRGVDVRAGPGPYLQEIRCVAGPVAGIPGKGKVALPAARVGDHLVLLGSNFSGSAFNAHLTPLPPIGSLPLLPQAGPPAIDKPAEPSPEGLTVDLTANNDKGEPEPWVSGVYNVQVVQDRGPLLKPLQSNAVPFRLAPLLNSVSAIRNRQTQTINVKIGFEPPVRPEQKATLIVGDFTSDQSLKPLRPTSVSELSFAFPGAMATQLSASSVVRLRIDGVESIPIDPSQNIRTFDSKQQLVIPR